MLLLKREATRKTPRRFRKGLLCCASSKPNERPKRGDDPGCAYFVRAPDEETAIAVFFAQRRWLATEDAEAFLISRVEPDDKKARVHLEQRLRPFCTELRVETG